MKTKVIYVLTTSSKILISVTQLCFLVDGKIVVHQTVDFC